MMRVIAGIVVLAACGGSRAAPPSREPSEPIEGNYEYIASIPGQQVRGLLRVLGDTILVEPFADYCQPATGNPDPIAIRYTCNGPGRFEQLNLRLDRRNPMQFSRWSATIRVTKRREVCSQYAIRDGRQVCVQTTTETYETNESSSGNLQVRRAP